MNIYSYIYFYLQAPKAAVNFRQNIIKLISNLYFFPYKYERLSNYSNLRKISIKNYIIIYEVNEFSKQVYVLNIFYGGQNYLDKI